MRFGVLGPLAVWADDGTPVPVPEPKVRTVLALLVLHAGRPVPADRLVEALWPGDLPTDPANALQTKVSQLRRALDAGLPGGRDLVRHHAAGYVLAADPESVDVTRFESLLDRAARCPEPERRVSLLTEALSLWRGPTVADLDAHMLARPSVTRLEEARLAAIEARVDGRLELGQHRELVAELAALVAEHPERERLCAAWMVALYRSGRHGEALTAYADLRRRLADERGLVPSPDLQALELAILRHDPSLEAPAPTPASGSTGPADPAGRAEGLIGRAEAVGDTRARMRAARLVTLVGPGGVGKTRLALEVARGVGAELADGVVLVELASLPPAGPGADTGDDAGHRAVVAVAEAVAAALGVVTSATPTTPTTPTSPTGGAAQDMVTHLGRALAEREVLLVLDNCEHVAEPVAAVVDRLLSAAPRLRLLATSREPLRLSREVVQEVPPLDLPRPGESPEDVARRASVQLFVARASAVAPGFAVDEGNAAAVAEVCRRLDGLPLAIELAAARMRALDVHDLARRLDDRFSLLGDGPRDAPDRHRTLFAVVDWSWRLLADDERTVLRRLAVFPDRFDLAAAEDVAAGDGVPRPAVAGVVARLVERSVVTRTEGKELSRPGIDGDGDGTIGGDDAAAGRPLATGGRYRLPESVAAHARSHPDPRGDDAATRRRHREHVARLVEQGAAGLRGPDQLSWLRRLDEAVPDLRAALDSAVEVADASVALRIADAAAWYWFLRGRIGEAHRSLRRALAVPGGPAARRARVVGWQAGFAVLSGLGPDAAALARGVDDAFAAAADSSDTEADGDDSSDAGDTEGAALARWFLGFALAGVSDPSLGEALNDRALAGFAATSSAWGCAAALSTSAWYAWQRGDLPAVRRAAEDAAARFAAVGDRWGELQAHQMLEPLAEVAGDYERAANLDRAALGIARDLGLPGDAAYALCRLGRVTLLQGDVAAAIDLHRQARRLAIEQSNVPLTQVAELGLALCHRRAGDLDQAEPILLRWLDWNRARANAPGVALVAAQLGFLAEQRGDAEQARARHDEAHAAALTTGDPRTIALTQEGQAGALALAGDHDRALALLAAAGAARAHAGAALPAAERFDVDRITTRLRSAPST